MPVDDRESIHCPTCGKRYKWKPQLAGRRVRCRGCGEPFTIPDQSESDAGIYDLDQEAPPSPAAPVHDGRCPNCGGSMRPEAIICINCGFNVKEGRKLEISLDDDDQDSPEAEKESPPS